MKLRETLAVLRTSAIWAALWLALWAVGCMGTTRQTIPDQPTPSPDPAEPTAMVQKPDGMGPAFGESFEGVASWYGRDFHGRPTASGKIYNMNAYTAAHRTLPFGTVLRVTNLANGRSLDVTVNDRGPFVGDRVLDLSYGAAKELGYVGSGTTNVRAQIVLKAGAPLLGGRAVATNRLRIGAYASRVDAERLYYYLRGRFSTTRIEGRQGDWKVYIGPFISPAARQTVYERLKGEGYDVETE
ncbi:MAG: septal ring lytic transglycosylase RlpA family protein [Myxococcales bacterium]|nr:MAG: septal ring lytic transglycosylase RlpA family protein [Myxococcales bacterium]